MPNSAGRKQFIISRTIYYRDYYISHKHEYLERYERKKNQQLVDKNYYLKYYQNWANVSNSSTTYKEN